MKNAEQEYVSVIGKNLLIPMVKLLESLKLSGVRSVNEVQTSPFENGYASAIILLAVLLLESMLNRTRYVMGLASKRKGDSVLTFFRSNFPDSGLCDKLVELFVVRDVIVHNHIWEAKIKYDKDYTLKLVSASLLEGYGDKKFNNAIDDRERKTRLLKINLFPTRICWSDIVTVLKMAIDILLFLEQKDRRYVYISDEYIEFDGETIKFPDIVSDLK